MSKGPFPPPGRISYDDAAAARAFVSEQPCRQLDVLGVARPTNEHEVKAVIDWANRYQICLTPVSSPSGPRRRGALASNRPTVILDLSGMSRVIHADGRDGIAVIEPGVTFPEFDARLHKYGLRSIKPLLPRRSKSVLACYLEREPTVAPNDHWDSTDPLAALSIVFGNGEQFRTGGASMPGSLQENLDRGLRQMMAAGPVTTDYTRVILGSQGTLGIACWGSIYCEKIPALEEGQLFASDTPQPLLAMVRHLALQQLGLHYFILDRNQLAAALADSSEDFARRCQQFHTDELPAWCLYVNIGVPDYLPEQAMQWQLGALIRIADSAGVTSLTGNPSEILLPLATRIQSLPERFYKDVPLGNHRDIFCLTQLSNVATLVAVAETTLGESLSGKSEDIAFGFYLQPMVQGTACHLEICLFHNDNATDIALAVERQLVSELSNYGGFFSRPYGNWADIAYQQNESIVPHLRRVKEIFDPAGILNAGRLCF